MMNSKIIYLLLLSAITMSASKCNKQESKKILNKIELDQTLIDEKGMVGGVAVDYEFCIPMDETKVAEVKSIEPEVHVPRMAKGRIGCSAEEYLCIVTAKGTDWKEKLYAIAALPYVKRIIQTNYE